MEKFLGMTIESVDRYKEIRFEHLTIGMLIVCDNNGFHLCNPEGKMFDVPKKITLEQLRAEKNEYQEYKKNILFSGFSNYSMGGFEWFKANEENIFLRYQYSSKTFYLGKNSDVKLKIVQDLEKYNLINLK